MAEWQAVRPDLELAPMATFGRLRRVHTHATRAIDTVFERHGLTIGGFDVLAALRRGREPRVTTPTALARLLMLSPAGMTNRLDRLQAAGLVERRPNPSDGRGVLVALTPAGRALALKATERMNAEVFSQLGLAPKRTGTLLSVLTELRRASGDLGS